MSSRGDYFVLAFVAMLGLQGVASAATINVDFNQAGGTAGTASGAAAIGIAGDLWNPIGAGSRAPTVSAGFTSGALFDTAGSGTSVTVSLGTHTAYDSTPDPNPAVAKPALMSDFAAASANNTALSFSINGLTSGGSYDLYLYSQNGGYGTESQTFTIGGVNKTAANSGNTALTEGVNYVKYLGLVATGGTISGSVLDSIGQASFNGFQITNSAANSTVVINVDIEGQRNDGGAGGTDTAGPTTLYSGTGPVGGTFVALGANSQTTSGSAADLADGGAGNPNGNADLLTVSNLNLGGSGIGFTVVGVGADDASTAAASNFGSLIGDYVFSNDVANNPVAAPPFTFSGLLPGSTADLYFYKSGGGISILGYVPTTGPGPAPFDTSNTLFFDNVLVSATGTISGTFTGSPAIVGGFTIVGIPVPEPSSYVLAMLGICLTAVVRRCRHLRAI